MRSYPPNSPEAAARVLAMALLADGHYSMTEIQALDRLQAARRLGLSAAEFKEVLDGFCHDLLMGHRNQWGGSDLLDAHIRSQLVSEITSPYLQTEVMELCAEVIKADGHLADGELAMIDSLSGAWPRRCGPAPVRVQTTERMGSQL